jgi:glycosyltransferase involved in cell wall biosynthesis
VSDGRPRHVVLLLNNPFTADSRSWKLARTLTDAGSVVTVVARAAPGLPERDQQDDIRVVRIAQPRPFARLPAPRLPSGEGMRPTTLDRVRDTIGRAVQAARYLLLARAWADRISSSVDRADIWQSEGLITLPVALRLRSKLGGLVVYDSRDVHVQSARFARLPGPWRRLLAHGERRWARSADAIVTVSEPYADVLRKSIGRSSTIVMNGPVAWDRPNRPERLIHSRLGLDAGTRVVLYLGAVVADRGVEQAIAAIPLVGDAALVIVGDGPAKPACQDLARQSPAADRIHFLAPAAPSDILPLTASADVSLMPVIPSTLNHRLNTPTKLFDAMGAGTPVVASDLPGMAPIVRETGCGVLCDPTSPADIARAIREVIDAPGERREAYSQACLAAAHGPYAWDRQVERLLDLYRVLEGPAQTPS